MLIERNKRVIMSCLAAGFVFLGFVCTAATGASCSALRVGWVVGNDLVRESAAILHTDDGGLNWTAYYNEDLLHGFGCNDVSAVDEMTAWVALQANDLEAAEQGRILCTTDGGQTWHNQDLPEDFNEPIKGIKGLSRQDAWAATIAGTILRTTDGGDTWNRVAELGCEYVNRMDATADGNVWVSDYSGGSNGLYHSVDGGLTWRKESFPDVTTGEGSISVSALNCCVVWSALSLQGDVYRTTDAGDTWSRITRGQAGEFDFDDICTTGVNTAWAVLNLSGSSGGTIYHFSVLGNGLYAEEFDPAPGYQYEGITCGVDSEVWVVGYRGVSLSDRYPDGIILHTTDGETWTPQIAPVSGTWLWKVSFVGAHR